MNMDTTIPLEIVDLFLENLQGDTETLTVTSLVCRSWLPISRYHLLSNMSVKIIQENGCNNKLEQLLSSPYCSIAPYIRHLHFKGTCPALPLCPGPATMSLIRTLSHIRGIILEDVAWMLIPTELQNIITSFDLVSLSISFVVFPSPSSLFHFIAAYPNLASLSLGRQVLCLEIDSSPSQNDPLVVRTKTKAPPPPLRGVRKLSIDVSREFLMPLFRQLSVPGKVDVLEMRFMNMSQSGTVNEFLDHTAPKHLTLDFGTLYQGRDIMKPDLASHLHLRSLTIEGLISRFYRGSVNLNATWAACMALLCTIQSRVFESLTICLKHLDSTAHLDWTTLDDILSRDTFRNVKTITFRIPHGTKSHREDIIALVRPLPHSKDICSYLPSAHDRGVLNFVYI